MLKFGGSNIIRLLCDFSTIEFALAWGMGASQKNKAFGVVRAPKKS